MTMTIIVTANTCKMIRFLITCVDGDRQDKNGDDHDERINDYLDILGNNFAIDITQFSQFEKKYYQLTQRIRK